jgi:ATP-dependent Clp protease ATP-binding subunit ClpB
VDIQVARLIARVAERGVTVELSGRGARPARQAGLRPVYGARPLKRVIQRHLVDPLARGLLQGDFSGGDHVRVDATSDGELTFAVAEPVSASAI